PRPDLPFVSPGLLGVLLLLTAAASPLSASRLSRRSQRVRSLWRGASGVGAAPGSESGLEEAAPLGATRRTAGRIHVTAKRRMCTCGQHVPSFGFSGDSRRICCSQCKTEDMVDLRNPRCMCGQHQPYFGVPGDARATCCSQCKKADMVDVKNPKCMCGQYRPSFGFLGDARATCCSQCKKADMVDVINRKCLCGQHQPFFGFPEDARATCCSLCKKEDMANLRRQKC
ncbi:unnamed protein product, partial [Polarella glacialis]